MARDRSLMVGTVLAVVALGVHMVLGITVGEAYAIPSTVVGAVAAAIILRGPVGQALARRLHGEASGGELPPETVLGELDDLRSRLLELEERMDFSERLLAQGREPAARGVGKPDA